MAKQSDPKFVDPSFVKISPKERANALASGQMPDDWDYQNIEMAIKMFMKRYPGEMERLINEVAFEIENSDIDYHASLSKTSGELRRRFWLPAQIMRFMDLAYPTISFGKNKRHVEWFLRKFPVFAYEHYTRKLKRQ